MGLLERAAMEAAKKMAESEESHTDVRGIVKASKVFLLPLFCWLWEWHF